MSKALPLEEFDNALRNNRHQTFDDEGYFLQELPSTSFHGSAYSASNSLKQAVDISVPELSASTFFRRLKNIPHQDFNQRIKEWLNLPVEDTEVATQSPFKIPSESVQKVNDTLPDTDMAHFPHVASQQVNTDSVEIKKERPVSPFAGACENSQLKARGLISRSSSSGSLSSPPESIQSALPPLPQKTITDEELSVTGKSEQSNKNSEGSFTDKRTNARTLNLADRTSHTQSGDMKGIYVSQSGRLSRKRVFQNSEQMPDNHSLSSADEKSADNINSSHPKKRQRLNRSQSQKTTQATRVQLQPVAQAPANRLKTISETELYAELAILTNKKGKDRHERDYLELLRNDQVKRLIFQSIGIPKSMRLLVEAFNADPKNKNPNIDFEEVRGALSYYNTHFGRSNNLLVGIDKTAATFNYDDFFKDYTGTKGLLDDIIDEFVGDNLEKIQQNGFSRHKLKKLIGTHNKNCAPEDRVGDPPATVAGSSRIHPERDGFIKYALKYCQDCVTPTDVLNRYKTKNKKSVIEVSHVQNWIIPDGKGGWRQKTLNERRSKARRE